MDKESKMCGKIWLVIDLRRGNQYIYVVGNEWEGHNVEHGWQCKT